MFENFNWRSFFVTLVIYFAVSLLISYLFADEEVRSSIFELKNLVEKLVSSVVFALVFEWFFRTKVKKMSDKDDTGR